MSSSTTSSSGKHVAYFEVTASAVRYSCSYWLRMSMPAPSPSEAVKARPSKTCSQPSSMMTITRWSPPSHRKNKTNSRHSWQPRTPAYHNRKAARNNLTAFSCFVHCVEIVSRHPLYQTAHKHPSAATSHTSLSAQSSYAPAFSSNAQRAPRF